MACLGHGATVSIGGQFLDVVAHVGAHVNADDLAFAAGELTFGEMIRTADGFAVPVTFTPTPDKLRCDREKRRRGRQS